MDIKDTTWIVIRLEDGSGELFPVIEGTTLTMVYDGERVSGTAGCNNYFGSASIGEKVEFGQLGSTMMMCQEPEGLMEQEQTFLSHLGKTDTVTSEGERLQLRSGETVLIEMAPLLVGLIGTWSLRSYNDGRQAMVSILNDTEITALFEDGRLRGHSGCNRYTTTYETDGGSVSIPPPVGTRMLCQEPEGLMDQETRYLDLLPSATTYLIRDGRHLELFDSEGTRILQYARA
jgi:heat shock protein HslJ